MDNFAEYQTGVGELPNDLYWGADKSLARPGMKQATATNLRLYPSG